MCVEVWDFAGLRSKDFSFQCHGSGRVVFGGLSLRVLQYAGGYAQTGEWLRAEASKGESAPGFKFKGLDECLRDVPWPPQHPRPPQGQGLWFRG